MVAVCPCGYLLHLATDSGSSLAGVLKLVSPSLQRITWRAPPCQTQPWTPAPEIITKDLKEKKKVVEEAENGRDAPANSNANEENGEQEADNEVDEEEEGGEEEEEEEEEEEVEEEEEEEKEEVEEEGE
ncbi:Prothymosin alpha [Microtus ochrogaster]|uniref:Prothymosin alpha n=1 Tax=Microtus ochrogaster TaxID=79684 RepID=A0A8J6G6W3_MICOH|nr:Prothymosin alpha [Microtus ochrogaster]